uniref:Uncharacterized protein n=2 Tax=Rhizophora mucronata TaxID=61149 RepID=A0A2P2JC77_RHIMU
MTLRRTRHMEIWTLSNPTVKRSRLYWATTISFGFRLAGEKITERPENQSNGWVLDWEF